MNQHEFTFASAVLEDGRKLIAAGKSQRWDVVKWAVTVNVALATASIALLKDHANAARWFFIFAIVIVLIAEALVLHYNNRMKNGRNDTLVTEKISGQEHDRCRSHHREKIREGQLAL